MIKFQSARVLAIPSLVLFRARIRELDVQAHMADPKLKRAQS